MENIYTHFGLSPKDNPKSKESLKKINNKLLNVCLLGNTDDLLKELEMINTLLDPQKKEEYDNSQEIQKKIREENLREKINKAVFECIIDKIPEGCFIEKIDCYTPYPGGRLRTNITIIKPTDKWVELCIDKTNIAGEDCSDINSTEVPYFNSKGYWSCQSYTVLDEDKRMPEYIKDLKDNTIPLAIPDNPRISNTRELRTLSNTSTIDRFEKEGIKLAIKNSRKNITKRMIVSSLDICYYFKSTEPTDKEIADCILSLEQIEVINKDFTNNLIL